MKKIINIAHNFLVPYCTENTIFVDFTLGNGHDAAFFYSKVKQLYAFDIQEAAIQSSLTQYPKLKQATLILDSHANIKNYVNVFDVGIFNLGYLPNHNKQITTTAETTVSAIKNALDILNPNGIICIVIYIGHDNGKIENQAIIDFIQTLPKTITIAKFELLNKNNAPYIILLQK